MDIPTWRGLGQSHPYCTAYQSEQVSYKGEVFILETAVKETEAVWSH